MDKALYIFEKLATDQAHQKRVLEKLDKTNRLLLYHGLGSGKTYTAIRAGEKYNLPTTVIGPAALKTNFAKEKKKHHLKTDVDYYTYSKPPNIDTSKNLVVFDEAHRMGRTESQRSHYPDAIKGTKTLFLTGTPLRNEPAELIPILRGLDIPVRRDKKMFNAQFVEEKRQNPGLLARMFLGVKPGTIKRGKNLGVLRKALKGKVDYYSPKQDENYPKVINEQVTTTMSKRQQSTYDMVMKGHANLRYKIRHGIAPSKTESGKMNAFLGAARQVSNRPGKFNLSATMEDAPKLNRATAEIVKRYKTNKNYKGVTYSAYLGHGVEAMAKRLDKAKVPYGMFTGKLSDQEKIDVVKKYNTGKIKQLLVSGAGGEGLDLKGTRLLQVLEPHWNEPAIEQVKGRVNRYLSHSKLPKSERNITIQTYINKPRKTRFLRIQHTGADEYLQMLAKSKQNLVNDFTNVLKEVGSNG